MNRCDYCGKQNEDTAATCTECGSPLALPLQGAPGLGEPSAVIAAPPIINPPLLNAGRATLVFLLTFVAQIIGAALVTGAFFAMQGVRGADLESPDATRELTRRIQPAAFLCSSICGVVVMLSAAALLVRGDLKERAATGAAWVLGTTRELCFGLGLGLATAVIFTVISAILAQFLHPELGPVSHMAVMRGAPQLVWIFLALVLAPAPEELLFRGILHGGYRRSFGPRAAAALTTLIFVAMHATEWSRWLPAILGITALALLTLWLRLRTRAIGPAIAAHLGYNAIIVLYAVLYTSVGTK